MLRAFFRPRPGAGHHGVDRLRQVTTSALWGSYVGPPVAGIQGRLVQAALRAVGELSGLFKAG